jgi:hypothetical protein
MTRSRWTEAELQLLRQRFADTPTADLARELQRPYSTVAAKAAELQLAKSPAYLASPAARRLAGQIGTATRFAPGHEPWNKGQAFEPGGRSVQTRFRPGQLNGHAARLAAPVGSYRVTRDGTLARKISDLPGAPNQRWRAVARLVWEAAHGPLPAGHAVVFKAGRRTTDSALITLDALELVTRAELMRRTTRTATSPTARTAA